MPRATPSGRRRPIPTETDRLGPIQQAIRAQANSQARERYNRHRPRNDDTPYNAEYDFNVRIRALRQRILNRIDDGGCVRRSTLQNPVFRWKKEEIDMMLRCLDLRETRYYIKPEFITEIFDQRYRNPYPWLLDKNDRLARTFVKCFPILRMEVNNNDTWKKKLELLGRESSVTDFNGTAMETMFESVLHTKYPFSKKLKEPNKRTEYLKEMKYRVSKVFAIENDNPNRLPSAIRHVYEKFAPVRVKVQAKDDWDPNDFAIFWREQGSNINNHDSTPNHLYLKALAVQEKIDIVVFTKSNDDNVVRYISKDPNDVEAGEGDDQQAMQTQDDLDYAYLTESVRWKDVKSSKIVANVKHARNFIIILYDRQTKKFSATKEVDIIDCLENDPSQVKPTDNDILSRSPSNRGPGSRSPSNQGPGPGPGPGPSNQGPGPDPSNQGPGPGPSNQGPGPDPSNQGPGPSNQGPGPDPSNQGPGPSNQGPDPSLSPNPSNHRYDQPRPTHRPTLQGTHQAESGPSGISGATLQQTQIFYPVPQRDPKTVPFFTSHDFITLYDILRKSEISNQITRNAANDKTFNAFKRNISNIEKITGEGNLYRIYTDTKYLLQLLIWANRTEDEDLADIFNSTTSTNSSQRNAAAINAAINAMIANSNKETSKLRTLINPLLTFYNYTEQNLLPSVYNSLKHAEVKGMENKDVLKKLNLDVFRLHDLVKPDELEKFNDVRRAGLNKAMQDAINKMKTKPYFDWMSLKVMLPKLIMRSYTLEGDNDFLKSLDHLKDYITVRLLTSYPMRDDLGELFLAKKVDQQTLDANKYPNRYYIDTGEVEIRKYKSSSAHPPIEFEVDQDLKEKIDTYLKLFRDNNPKNPNQGKNPEYLITKLDGSFIQIDKKLSSYISTILTWYTGYSAHNQSETSVNLTIHEFRVSYATYWAQLAEKKLITGDVIGMISTTMRHNRNVHETFYIRTNHTHKLYVPSFGFTRIQSPYFWHFTSLNFEKTGSLKKSDLIEVDANLTDIDKYNEKLVGRFVLLDNNKRSHGGGGGSRGGGRATRTRSVRTVDDHSFWTPVHERFQLGQLAANTDETLINIIDKNSETHSVPRNRVFPYVLYIYHPPDTENSDDLIDKLEQNSRQTPVPIIQQLLGRIMLGKFEKSDKLPLRYCYGTLGKNTTGEATEERPYNITYQKNKSCHGETLDITDLNNMKDDGLKLLPPPAKIQQEEIYFAKRGEHSSNVKVVRILPTEFQPFNPHLVGEQVVVEDTKEVVIIEKSNKTGKDFIEKPYQIKHNNRNVYVDTSFLRNGYSLLSSSSPSSNSWVLHLNSYLQTYTNTNTRRARNR
jgi:hypothetical protein